MKIATFNINGIKARIETVPLWLQASQPDVAVLQEIKSVDEAFPREVFEDLGYRVETHGQKGFNGVAILSKLPLEDVTRGLPGDHGRRTDPLDRGDGDRRAGGAGLRPLPAQRQPRAGAEIRLQARLDGAAAPPRAGTARDRGAGGPVWATTT